MGPQRVETHLDSSGQPLQREWPLQLRERRRQLLEDDPDVWERRDPIDDFGGEGRRERIPRSLVLDTKRLLEEEDGLI